MRHEESDINTAFVSFLFSNPPPELGLCVDKRLFYHTNSIVLIIIMFVIRFSHDFEASMVPAAMVRMTSLRESRSPKAMTKFMNK